MNQHQNNWDTVFVFLNPTISKYTTILHNFCTFAPIHCS